MARFLGLHIRLISMIGVIAVVILCAGLAASAANHVIEGKYLGDSLDTPDSALVPAATTGKRANQTAGRTKSSEQLIERNLFCAECTPAKDSHVLDPVEPGGIPLTTLPLELIATSIASEARASFATIRNTRSEQQGAFAVGDAIPGAGPIELITGTYVVFQNLLTQRAEKVSLESQPAGSGASASGPASSADASSPYSDRVKQTGERSYEVDREIIGQVMANPAQLGARAVPAQSNGKITGIRLYGIRAGSPLTAIGLESGDTVQTINGYELTSPDKMLEAYQKLQTADNLSVMLLRKGESVEMRYQVR